MAEDDTTPTTAEHLNMLKDQLEDVDRSVVYCDTRFVYGNTFSVYRMNMN